MQKINETGNQYGRLTVIGNSPSKKKGALWICRCACGNTTIVSGRSLRTGDTKSCGCLNQDLRSARSGIKNPSFTTGQRLNYNKKEQKDFHDHIRKRDNYACGECGRSQEDELGDTGRKLDVHHRDGNHWNNENNNAVTLCRACHNKIGADDKWLKKEQEALEISIKVADETT